MGYPDPIPALEGREAEEFNERLSRFRLNGAQKEFYREAKELFGKEK